MNTLKLPKALDEDNVSPEHRTFSHIDEKKEADLALKRDEIERNLLQ